MTANCVLPKWQPPLMLTIRSLSNDPLSPDVVTRPCCQHGVSSRSARGWNPINGHWVRDSDNLRLKKEAEECAPVSAGSLSQSLTLKGLLWVFCSSSSSA